MRHRKTNPVCWLSCNDHRFLHLHVCCGGGDLNVKDAAVKEERETLGDEEEEGKI